MFSTHQRLNVKHANKKHQMKNEKALFLLPKNDFNNWLAGITDGDGSFSFSKNKKKNSIWNCTFKITQSTYNLRLLYFIKHNLGYGSINNKSGKNMAEFRITDRKTLISLIVPLFTQYPLYSTKHFYFLRWVKALHVLENYNYTTIQKNAFLTKLKSDLPLETYISAAWESNVPSNEWIYGFIEAEGSFFSINNDISNVNMRLSTLKSNTSLCKNNEIGKMVHSFNITQKLDKIILEFLQKKFHISSKIVNTKNTIYKLETTNSRSILKIQSFFLHKLKGIKSLEYRIWARSINYKKNNDKLFKIQNQLRKMRNKLKDKT